MTHPDRLKPIVAGARPEVEGPRPLPQPGRPPTAQPYASSSPVTQTNGWEAKYFRDRTWEKRKQTK